MTNNALDFELADKTDTRNRQERQAIQLGSELAREALVSAGASGRWLCSAAGHIKWSSPRRFSVRHVQTQRDHTRGIYVRCKPGDNGSAWEFQLKPPPVFEDSQLHEIFTRLKALETVKAEPPTSAPATDGRAASVPAASQAAAPIPDMTTVMSNFAAIAARAQKRQEHLAQLVAQKAAREMEIEDLMADLQSTDGLIASLQQEQAEDREAQALTHFMTMMGQLRTA